MIKVMTHFSTSIGTVIQNGTEKHKKYLDMADRGELVCAFGMTELGGGNNIGSAGTVATFDHKTRSFIFHNQNPSSMKFWAAGLGRHANYSIVFATTIVNGKNEGVHSFLVPIRDKKGSPLPGVTLGDFGHKIGVNGIDNGFMLFTNYKVPYECLLNKYNDIDEQGVFKSSVKGGLGQRFFTTIERLNLGRICLTGVGYSALKNAVYIGVKFSRKRWGVA